MAIKKHSGENQPRRPRRSSPTPLADETENNPNPLASETQNNSEFTAEFGVPAPPPDDTSDDGNETQNNPELTAESGAPALLPGDTSDDDEAHQRHNALPFPIVGAGASAGGLEAFTQLLQSLSPNLGMAIVFVQHLSPGHESLLTSLLSRVTSLPVTTIVEGMRVVPNQVFIMPPNTYLTIAQGVFHLTSRTDTPRPFIPIDNFLRSLALDQVGNAIAVILSGTGSDGALGIEAIKAEGGITFAQEELSAQQPSMPRSAISTGAVDFILPPAEIAKALNNLTSHPYLHTLSSASVEPLTAPANVFEEILYLIRTACGTDLRQYRQTSLRRRILRRMALRRIDTLSNYLTYLQSDPVEVQALYRDVLIRVTAFFRDHEIFDALQATVFPRLIQGRAIDTPIRIWVPGCATGEEAYSIAIALREFLDTQGAHFPIQIFGTDVSEEAIAKCRLGIYIENIAADISPERLRRFFIPMEKSYQVSKSLREVCIFARQDITQDPPFSNLDLVSCRNVLIYMEPELQKRLLYLFHYALKPSKFLLLGVSESPNVVGSYFTVHDARTKIYTKEASVIPPNYNFGSHSASSASTSQLPSQEPSAARIEGLDAQRQADRLVLSVYAPPGVILNRDLEILHFRGDTSAFLTPAPGKASFHILKMAREGLLVDLRTALTEATRDGEPVIKSGLQVVQNGDTISLTLRVLPFSSPSGDRYFLVLFEDPSASSLPQREKRQSPRKPRSSSIVVEENARLHKELATTREYLQAMIEEREAANEELQSANEEALSANEELQSINEELETAKEELQSSNEELTTLNEELQSRNNALAQLSADITNLLTVMDIPILLVDRELRIRRFTPAAGALLNLLPLDVGRPLTDLRLRVQVADFEQLISHVIETLIPIERELQGPDQQWYMLTIRPAQTEDKHIAGAVIIFMNITLVKERELQYRQLYEQGFATASDAMVLVEASTGRISEVNPRFVSLLGWTRDEVIGKPLWEVPGFFPLADNETTFQALTNMGYHRFEDLSLQTKEGQQVDVDVLSTVSPVGGDDLFQLTLHDLSERKRIEATLRDVNQSLVRMNENLQQFAYAASHDLSEPMRQISLYLQLLDATLQGQVNAEARQHLDFCLQTAQRMRVLLEDLLAYVRAGEIQGEIPFIDGNVVFRQAVENLQETITKKGAVITADPLPVIPAYEGHFMEILQNLLSNALKYCEAPTPTIHVSATQQDGVGVFSVRDNGIGIDPQYQRQIFGIFKRLHGEQYDGTGIGLAICQKIVERYGGRIWVESAPEQGSTFFFTLDKEVKP